MKFLWLWVNEGEGPPWYMGFAIKNLLRRQRLMVIMPFNWLVRLFDNILWSLEVPKFGSLREVNCRKVAKKEFDLGVNAGYSRGFKAGYAAHKDVFMAALEEQFGKGKIPLTKECITKMEAPSFEECMSREDQNPYN